MSLQVFNTLSNKKEEFVPLDGKNVRMYACGPTVYDSSHLGHARMAIVWDVIQRYLRSIGYNVTFVRNITDVDDKIINRAKELGISPDQLARQYTFEYWRDMYALNVMAPDFEPKATEFIAPMIQFVKELIEAGHAYEANGDVYFDVASFKEYGKLSKQNLEQLQSGAREQVRTQEDLASIKKNPVDFALWKSADEAELGWPSPWGYGRPGWHLECSTMIRTVLGESIDIHGGGEDLVFPHHENEIAQSESLFKKNMAKYWMHNSFVQVSAEKMSKSLGNFKTINSLLENYSADTLRLLILQTHYRNPIDFTADSLAGAKTAVLRLVRAAALDAEIDQNGDVPAKVRDAVAEAEKQFSEAMDNDFNTAVAISALFSLADKVFQTKNSAEQKAYAAALVKLAKVLGFTLADTRREIEPETAKGVMDLVLELRKNARENKDYATSDLIRKELAQLGINVMDAPGGATWEKT
ncbi:MAG: cysteine--tRNA ligase [Candidatus Melainabacteria bacterium]|nr:cysteine--tRNA ligase [Candidatus Melainabacteria bacterium]